MQVTLGFGCPLLSLLPHAYRYCHASTRVSRRGSRRPTRVRRFGELSMVSSSGPGSPGRRAADDSGDPAASPRPAQPRTLGESPLGGLSSVAFLTVAEVANLMRVSKMTVYRLLHSGELAGVRVGRSFRVPESAVHNYLRDAFNDTA